MEKKKNKNWQIREDLPICIKMEASITPGLTKHTLTYFLPQHQGKTRQVGHFQAQRDSFASDLKITVSSIPPRKH